MVKSSFRVPLAGNFIIAILFSLSLPAIAFAQATDTVLTITEASINDLPAKPFRMPSLQDVGGNPFFNSEYRQGSVELGQGRIVNNVPLKFNTFNNAMMVIKDGKELKLEFFELASFDENDYDGQKKHYVFKAGYPEIDGHNENAIYQVLSMGPRVHLLKFISQKVEDVPTLGDYSRREIVTTEQFYVYVPGGEIKKIKSLKSGKQSLQEALPALSAKIDEISVQKKLKLRSESDIS
ncbi:MAG TPA: hypothetical protein VFX58_14000, partial [Chitinophagaceae bacterium]|nr:hypothetical protein [Chitinophagaceae bacterium]